MWYDDDESKTRLWESVIFILTIEGKGFQPSSNIAIPRTEGNSAHAIQWLFEMGLSLARG